MENVQIKLRLRVKKILKFAKFAFFHKLFISMTLE